MTATLITSQSFIDEEIVAAKIEAGDFEVQVSPEFEIDGRAYQVIMDGHHSFEAARQAGVEAEIIVQSPRENDRVAILLAGDIDTFLELAYVDSEYRIAGTDMSAF